MLKGLFSFTVCNDLRHALARDWGSITDNEPSAKARTKDRGKIAEVKPKRLVNHAQTTLVESCLGQHLTVYLQINYAFVPA